MLRELKNLTGEYNSTQEIDWSWLNKFNFKYDRNLLISAAAFRRAEAVSWNREKTEGLPRIRSSILTARAPGGSYRIIPEALFSKFSWLYWSWQLRNWEIIFLRTTRNHYKLAISLPIYKMTQVLRPAYALYSSYCEFTDGRSWSSCARTFKGCKRYRL